MEVVILAVWGFILTLPVTYIVMREFDERKEANTMNLIEAYDQETIKTENLTKVEQWFVSLSREERDFVARKAVLNPAGTWRAPMWRAAKKNGLDAGLTSFKEFLAELRNNSDYMRDYLSGGQKEG